MKPPVVPIHTSGHGSPRPLLAVAAVSGGPLCLTGSGFLASTTYEAFVSLPAGGEIVFEVITDRQGAISMPNGPVVYEVGPYIAYLYLGSSREPVATASFEVT